MPRVSAGASGRKIIAVFMMRVKNTPCISAREDYMVHYMPI